MVLSIDSLRSFPIGRKEDGGVETVVFDCTAWRTAYPFLTDYRLEVTAPNGLVYIPVITEQGNCLIWDIKQSDTLEIGKGEYQIVATGAEGLRKTSDHLPLYVLSIMEGADGQEPPEPSKAWTDEVTQAAARAKAEADRAEQIANDISGGVIKGALRFDAVQELTEEEKALARANIGIVSYKGAYSVTPSTEGEVTLETAQKLMDADITVKKIPFFDVSNDKGGSTVYIGNEV